VTGVVLVHGGAHSGRIGPGREAPIRAGLREAAEAGRAALVAGAGPVEAAVAAVSVLEDSEHFNAGYGAALTADGEVELDAAVMDGSARRAGAVAVLSGYANPVRVAQAVLADGRHVLLAGAGAARFAEHGGFERTPHLALVTRRRFRRWHRVREPVGHDTVGAVVCDAHGRLAAATSTGGMSLKAPGRVGDSPVPGGGVFADDRRCAVSASGDGERLLEAVAAHDVAARVSYLGLPIDEAVQAMLAGIRGKAGLIAVDPDGNVGIAANTPLFRRALVRGDGPVRTALRTDEELR
jgi:L-asparaginase / beta-aspartyl-peptidase